MSKYLIFICLVVSIIITTSCYDEQTNYISNAEQLQSMSKGKNVLTNDIDLTDFSWTPISINGTDELFTLDGNGYSINNLSSNGGLFEYTEYTIIKDLSLTNVDITSNSKITGALIDHAFSSSIYSTYVSGTINGKVVVTNTRSIEDLLGDNYFVSYFEPDLDDYSSITGGLVGYGSRISVVDSQTNVTLNGSSNIGGIAGLLFNSIVNTTLSNSIIYGTDRLGGLIGRSVYNDMSNSYSVTSINGSSNIGGIVGFSTFSSLYNTFTLGNIEGESRLGGIYGSVLFSVTYNSYTTVDIVGTSNVGNIRDYSSDSGHDSGFHSIYSFSEQVIIADDEVNYTGTIISLTDVNSEWFKDTNNWNNDYLWDENIWDFSDLSNYHPTLRNNEVR